MKLRAILAITVFALALPALAAPNCPAPQILVGNNCTLTVALGWAAADKGINSIVSFYVPPNVTGAVRFQVTALSSSLGSAYTGYFGIVVGFPGNPGKLGVLTLADIIAGGPSTLGPGKELQFLVTQVCWDPTCTAAAPAGAVPNMFSMQLLIASPNPGDINITPNPGVIIQFLSGSRVNFQATVNAQRSNSTYAIILNINLGATPAGRYVYDGAAVTLPFDALSISNINNPNATSGSATLQDIDNNTVAIAPIPAIPPGGAAGFLLMGRTPGDPLGLFPSSTVLPAGPDGIFHGTLIIGMLGLTPNGFNIIAAQEFNGNSMLNLFVAHSPIP
jgi:hypothetical protein